MITSMTAFARTQRTSPDMDVSVEIRSTNGRYLDTVLRLPQSCQPLEERVRALVAGRVVRGRVELKVQVEERVPEIGMFRVDADKARAYLDALAELGRFLGRPVPEVDLMTLAAVPGILAPREIERDVEARWPLIRECVEEALEAHDAMRRREGDFLREDFRRRLDAISSALTAIEVASADLTAVCQTKLRERITALTQGMVDIDPTRIAQEAAFLADRSDISEEIVRAGSHVRQFHAIMDGEEAGGRKLNFLLQEMNREFNTMGSKTASTDVSHLVVEVKSELEKIREQVQNIE